MLRLFGFLVMTCVGVGGLMTIDYTSARKELAAAEDRDLSVGEYLGGITERISRVTNSVSGKVPTKLTAMLPRPPEGWTVRPIDLKDVGTFLPGDGDKADDDMIRLVESAASSRVAGASEVVVQTYEKGERRVMVQAALFSDDIFKGVSNAQQRFDLQMASQRLKGRPFMTVRGLVVTEVFLGGEMRGRLFVADVAGQLHLRVLAPKRMKDAELVPFFETLHVKAMNYAVVDQIDGLGEVPVIALASAMDEDQRAAFEADHEAERMVAAARAEEQLQLALLQASAEAEAEAAANPPEGDAEIAADGVQKPGLASDCQQGSGGIKRCSVGATE